MTENRFLNAFILECKQLRAAGMAGPSAAPFSAPALGAPCMAVHLPSYPQSEEALEQQEHK